MLRINGYLVPVSKYNMLRLNGLSINDGEKTERVNSLRQNNTYVKIFNILDPVIMF